MPKNSSNRAVRLSAAKKTGLEYLSVDLFFWLFLERHFWRSKAYGQTLMLSCVRGPGRSSFSALSDLDRYLFKLGRFIGGSKEA